MNYLFLIHPYLNIETKSNHFSITGAIESTPQSYSPCVTSYRRTTLEFQNERTKNNQIEQTKKPTEDVLEEMMKKQRTPQPPPRQRNIVNEATAFKTFKYHSFNVLSNDHYLYQLEEYVKTKTTPEGLIPNVPIDLPLSDAQKLKCSQILQETGRKLRSVVIDHFNEIKNFHSVERNKLKTKLKPELLDKAYQEIREEYRPPSKPISVRLQKENGNLRKRKPTQEKRFGEEPQRKYQKN